MELHKQQAKRLILGNHGLTHQRAKDGELKQTVMASKLSQIMPVNRRLLGYQPTK